jgi:hypothetical protein
MIVRDRTIFEFSREIKIYRKWTGLFGHCFLLLIMKSVLCVASASH